MKTISQIEISNPYVYSPEIEKQNINGEMIFEDKKKRLRQKGIKIRDGKHQDYAISKRTGKYSRFQLPSNLFENIDVAIDATLRAAANRRLKDTTGFFEIHNEDIQVKIRRHRSPYAIVFVVDNSWSIQADITLAQTKGAVFEFLTNAYNNKDKIALVTFKHSRAPKAITCMPFTRSFSLAAQRLRNISLSGTTPLPDGIRKALSLLHQEVVKHHNAIPVMVIVSDGLFNVPLRPKGDPYYDIKQLCQKVRERGICTIIVDTLRENSKLEKRNCLEIANLTNGKYIKLSELSAKCINETLFSIYRK